MNTYVSRNLKKILSTLLMSGILVFSPFATYAFEEDIATTTNPTILEITELNDDPTGSSEESMSTDVTPENDLAIDIYEPEIQEIVSDNPTEDGASTALEFDSSITIDEVTSEDILISDQPVSFVRARIEPVQPPSRDSFRNQPQLRPAPKQEKMPLLLPPPFKVPGEPLITSTTSDALAEIATSSELTETDPTIVDEAVIDDAEEVSTDPTSDDLVIPSGDPIATTTKEDIVPDDVSDENEDPESDSEMEMESTTPISKPEEVAEEVVPETETSF